MGRGHRAADPQHHRERRRHPRDAQEGQELTRLWAWARSRSTTWSASPCPLPKLPRVQLHLEDGVLTPVRAGPPRLRVRHPRGLLVPVIHAPRRPWASRRSRRAKRLAGGAIGSTIAPTLRAAAQPRSPASAPSVPRPSPPSSTAPRQPSWALAQSLARSWQPTAQSAWVAPQPVATIDPPGHRRCGRRPVPARPGYHRQHRRDGPGLRKRNTRPGTILTSSSSARVGGCLAAERLQPGQEGRPRRGTVPGRLSPERGLHPHQRPCSTARRTTCAKEASQFGVDASGVAVQLDKRGPGRSGR